MSLPIWKLDFSRETKNYFIENGDYTGDLLGKIFMLAYYDDPRAGCTALTETPVVYVLALDEHQVFFTFEEGLIRVFAVKPD
jgi:hypothetical protein